jgi:hypothetical protein
VREMLEERLTRYTVHLNSFKENGPNRELARLSQVEDLRCCLHAFLQAMAARSGGDVHSSLQLHEVQTCRQGFMQLHWVRG